VELANNDQYQSKRIVLESDIVDHTAIIEFKYRGKIHAYLRSKYMSHGVALTKIGAYAVADSDSK
jgi:hypothetical protein